MEQWVVISDETSTSRIRAIRHHIIQADSIVALTGAGISLASGVPLLGQQIDGRPVSELFDREFFESNAEDYYKLYADVLLNWRSVLPNPAHTALTKAGVWVVTLNIDGLHRDACTERLIEMHGNLRELRCKNCSGIFESRRVFNECPPKCVNCNTVLEPGIAMHGDEIRHYSLAMDWVGRATCMLIIGTSLHDEPASHLPQVAMRKGIPIIAVQAQAERIVPKLFE